MRKGAKGSTGMAMRLSRRTLLRRTSAAAVAGIAGSTFGGQARSAEPVRAAPVRAAPTAPNRGAGYVPSPGATQYDLTIVRTPLAPDGARAVPAVTVNGSIPGPEIRVREGDQLRILARNGLADSPTAVHWHGLLVPAGMDGVPGISNSPIAPGEMYVYEFPIRQSGTYWYHSHVGFQEQLGMYGAFVIEAADDPVRADHDVVVLLGDWLHRSPESVFAGLRGEAGGATPTADGAKTAMNPGTASMASMDMKPGTAAMPGMDSQPETAATPGMGMKPSADLADVAYPSFLLNGRGPASPWSFAARPGERIRLRIVNSAASTYFRVALDGHPLTVTHADGIAVEPVVVDHLLMGMAEGYDVLVTLSKPGSYTLHAVAQDGSGQAIGVLHTPDAPAAPSSSIPAFSGPPLQYAQLRALAPTTLPTGPSRTFRLPLQGDMKAYVWMIDGQAWPKADPLRISPGDRVQLELVNETMMWHPMHLHGHFFRVLQGAGERAPLKHTVNVAPRETVRIEFTADNPGRWFFHCHNAYHLEAGMAREFVYAS